MNWRIEATGCEPVVTDDKGYSAAFLAFAEAHRYDARHDQPWTSSKGAIRVTAVPVTDEDRATLARWRGSM